jgi:DNA-binding NarL/FixJ family response regulator
MIEVEAPVIDIALVEDDTLINDLVSNLLRYHKEVNLVRSYFNAEDFLQDIHTISIHVAILDIGMPGMGGIEGVRAAKSLRPEIEFLMFTQSVQKDNVFEALKAGATGYVSKTAPIEELVESIHEVHKGGSPMSREIARLVATSFKSESADHSHLTTLTAQEIKILQELDKGYAYKQIADHMNISENTIKTHVRHIYEKLQVHTRTEALNKLNKRY